jgi:uncharacterized protein (TIGR03437 family)
MSKLIVSICLFVPALFGQFHNLTTTDDGAVLLFSSSLRLRGANQHPWEKLFRIDAAGLSLYMERDRTVPSEFSYVTNAYRMMRAEFSGDGKVTALIARADCAVGGSTCLDDKSKYQSEISLPGQPATVFTGQARLSRNGRYAVLCCDDRLAAPSELRDLSTGETRNLQARAGMRSIVTSAGVAVVPDVIKRIRVIGFDGARAISTTAYPRQIAADDLAKTAVYEGMKTANAKILARIDLLTAVEEPLIEAPDLTLVGMSNSGDRIAFLASAGLGESGAEGSVQLYTISPDGTGLRQATHDSAGITEAVLAGAGTVAYAVTSAGRILRIDLDSDLVTELIGRTVTLHEFRLPCNCENFRPVPGSAFCIGGTGLADAVISVAPPLPSELGGLQLSLDRRPVPLQRVSPTQACFQVLWDTGTGTHTPSAATNSDPRFEGGSDFAVEILPTAFASFVRLGPPYLLDVALGALPLVAHQDFSGLVTPSRPAIPGEVLHFYMTGLGPVNPPVGLGEASPGNPPAVVITQPVCRMATFNAGDSIPLEVLFAGLAPGYAGYYQVSIRMPLQIPAREGEALLSCSVGAPYAGQSVWLPVRPD